jgi:hypothetical protein
MLTISRQLTYSEQHYITLAGDRSIDPIAHLKFRAIPVLRGKPFPTQV